MREELRRNNYIGDKESIKYFCSILLKNDKIGIKSLKSICSFNSKIKINLTATLAFFEYLNLICVDNSFVWFTELGKKIALLDEPSISLLSEQCINSLIEDSTININGISFDYDTKEMYIHKYAFPLYAAIFKNFLLEIGAIFEFDAEKYLLNEESKSLFFKKIQANHKKISNVELLKRLEKQREQGLMAEEFVLQFEKKCLATHPLIDSITRISDFDVSAGYDVVSFSNDKATKIDKYIEVKSFIGSPHFYWSTNEIEVAKLKGENYYLYLVDNRLINDSNYMPVIIRNPSINIFDSNEWIIEPDSYRVQKII